MSENIRKQVEIYTDGACSGNPGIGGWAAVLLYNGHRKEISGAFDDTTNNRMELTAIIEGLKQLKEPCDVTLFSDSAYSVDPFAKNWLDGWIARGWRTSTNDAVKNSDLWKELLSLTKIHNVTFVKVKGHADNALNNRCDLLARTAIKNMFKMIKDTSSTKSASNAKTDIVTQIPDNI